MIADFLYHLVDFFKGIDMLKNKIVFITGASSGIGAACAEHFAKIGAKLLLCSRRINVIQELAKSLQQRFHIEVYTFACDVQNAEQVATNLNTLPDAWKNIEVVINNAGLAAGLEPFQEGKLEDWNNMIDTNIKGLLYITRQILPSMMQKNAGHIINIGSIAGQQPYPKGAVYCATKAAVNVISEGLRMDLLGTKIRVTSVNPGMVETNFSVTRFKGDTQQAANVYQGMTPLSADDVAETVVYCATRPLHVNISEVLIMPTDQVATTMVARQN